MPVRCEIRGAAGGGGECAKLAGGSLAFRFGEIVVEGAGRELGDLREDGGFEFIAFLRRALGGDGDEPFLAGIDPCPCGDLEGEFALISEVQVQAGGAATAEYGGEHVVGGCIRIIDGRCLP